jgi:hypothetical protein
MLATRIKRLSLLLVSALACVALPASANIVVNQEGNQNPISNGFAPGPATQGPVAGPAWNVQGSWCCSYDYYSLTSAQVSSLTSATNWAWTATFANLSPQTTQNGYGPGSYGSYADIILNDNRFDLDLGSDGGGNQILFVNSFGGAPSYTITGLGTNPVTLEVLYNNATSNANIYVNGTEVIANYAGYSYGYSNLAFFGGQDGNFSQVELQTNVSAPTTTPEPVEMPVLALGAGCLGFLLWRRRRAATSS